MAPEDEDDRPPPATDSSDSLYGDVPDEEEIIKNAYYADLDLLNHPRPYSREKQIGISKAQLRDVEHCGLSWHVTKCSHTLLEKTSCEAEFTTRCEEIIRKIECEATTLAVAAKELSYSPDQHIADMRNGVRRIVMARRKLDSLGDDEKDQKKVQEVEMHDGKMDVWTAMRRIDAGAGPWTDIPYPTHWHPFPHA